MSAGTWLLVYTGEYVSNESEVESREKAAIAQYGRVCYTWAIEDVYITHSVLQDAATKGAYVFVAVPWSDRVALRV